MFHYYQNHPSTVATLNRSTQTQAATSGKTSTMSEFDKHYETLLSNNMEEEWASELIWYLSTMQWEVTKQTDIIEWWQVSKFEYINFIVYLLHIL